MSPFVLLLGEPPIMLPNMKYISPEKSLFPLHQYMETSYYIKIFIAWPYMYIITFTIEFHVHVANQPKTN